MNSRFKIPVLILLMTFAVAYCHFATEVIFSANQTFDVADLKREYLQSLFVGFMAAVFGVLGQYFLFDRKKRDLG